MGLIVCNVSEENFGGYNKRNIRSMAAHVHRMYLLSRRFLSPIHCCAHFLVGERGKGDPFRDKSGVQKERRGNSI